MPKPIKILHVISSLDQRDGGPVRAIVDLSAASEEYGVESHLLAPGPLELPDNPLPAGRIHITPPAVFHAFRYAPSLRRWLRRHGVNPKIETRKLGTIFIEWEETQIVRKEPC